ncbi:cysteine synthase [Halobacteriales archaeon QS_1_68_20]|nr:MAG: cysteine synthase [Halobacteriales archaeon QS_1_68_20]
MRDTILDALGSPLVRVGSPEGATIAAKLEAFNPGGSAKDRPALAMIEAAERGGELEPGDSVVEATSGNTGIGLAMVCAARGYNLTLVMPDRMSRERRRLLGAYGADLELVDGDMTTARERADELAADGGVRPRQFENEANPDAHYRTTAEEILDGVGDREIDAFVAAVGTGGTITGTATRLREECPEMEVVGVEPARNAVLSTGEAGDDEYQGMGPGFVSDLLDRDLVDDVETVAIEDAEAECRRLAREEGILVGQSSGAASLAATRVAERLADPALDCPPAPAALSDDEVLGAGTRPSPLTSDGGEAVEYDDCPLVVTVFPDSGERYLSAGTFD